MTVRLSAEPIDPGALLSGFSRGRAESGAVVSFTGVARAEAGRIRGLVLEAYPGFTEAAIAATLQDARRRFSLHDALVIHRTGEMAPGEPIVFVAAAAAHRREAFQGVDFLMDYLKSRAPFWKKSVEADGHRWILPSEKDYEDAARWDAPESLR